MPCHALLNALLHALPQDYLRNVAKIRREFADVLADDGGCCAAAAAALLL